MKLCLFIFLGIFLSKVNSQLFTFFPQIGESCVYYRPLLIENLSGSELFGVEVNLEFDVGTFSGSNDFKTDCNDIVIIDNFDNRLEFFLEKSCIGQSTESTSKNRLYFNVNKIEVGETLHYKFYYGCKHIDASREFKPSFDWIFMSTKACPSPFVRYDVMDGKLLRIDSEFGNDYSINYPHNHHVFSGYCGTTNVSEAVDTLDNGGIVSGVTHDHTINAFDTESTTTMPKHMKVFFCAGKKLDFFEGALFLTNGNFDDGQKWRKHEESDDYFFSGATSIGDIETTGGSKTHVHYINTITRNNTAVNDDRSDVLGDPFALGEHFHKVEGFTEPRNNVPPFYAFHVIESLQNGNTIDESGSGVFFLANSNEYIPFGYEQVFFADAYFVMSSSPSLGVYSFGDTGGSYDHLHNIDFTISGPSYTINMGDGGTTEDIPTGKHKHGYNINTEPSKYHVPPHVNLTLYKRKDEMNSISVTMGDEVQDYVLLSFLIVFFSVFGSFGFICILCCFVVILIICVVLISVFVVTRFKTNRNLKEKNHDIVEKSKDSLVIEKELENNNSNSSVSLKNSVGKSLKEFFSSFKRRKSVKSDEIEDKNEPKVILHNNLSEINMEEVKLVKHLGSGGSGANVYECEWNSTICAFKLFKTGSSFLEETKDFHEFEKEVAMIGSLKHPFIIQHYGWVIKGPRVGILLEFCGNGELMQFILKQKKKSEDVSLKERIRLCTEISEGLRYLHSKNIIHRDVKSNNVLISQSKNAKIIDFGLAKIHESTSSDKQTVRVGTSYYMAPEVLSGKYDSKCDVFSYSIVLFEVFSENQRPYKGREDGVVELKVANDKNFRPIIPEDKIIPKEIVDLMKQCWEHDPADRPTFEEVTKLLKKIEIE